MYRSSRRFAPQDDRGLLEEFVDFLHGFRECEDSDAVVCLYLCVTDGNE